MIDMHKTFIICELSQTHEGNWELARSLVRAAAVAKADAVKFQVFEADELAVPAYKHYALFKKLEWSRQQWADLIQEAHQLGLKALADVFGLSSARMLKTIGIDGIKIHATDIRNKPLLKEFSGYDLPLFLSCGGAYEEELKEAAGILKAGPKKPEIILMHGFQSYPTLIEHTNLLKMKMFGEALKLPYGFADHIDGDHPQSFSLCALAVGMGASVIEKHITSDRALKMEDYESALDPKSFVDFVLRIRELDAAKGTGKDELLPVEKDYRSSTRKHVTALKPLKKGVVVGDTDVALKRALSEEAPADLENILGKKLDRDIAVHEVILEKDVS